MENQEITKKDIVDIDRVIFKEINDSELNIIENIKSKKVTRKYFKNMVISIFVILIVFAVQSIGNVTKDNGFTYLLNNKKLFFVEMKNYFVWMLVVFIIFNVVSLFCSVVKRELVMITDNYSILYDAVVSDKYQGRKLGIEGRDRRNYYVVFECDQGVCSKALATNKSKYNSVKIGDKIVILKEMSVEGYTLRFFKDEEFRSVHNS